MKKLLLLISLLLATNAWGESIYLKCPNSSNKTNIHFVYLDTDNKTWIMWGGTYHWDRLKPESNILKIQEFEYELWNRGVYEQRTTFEKASTTIDRINLNLIIAEVLVFECSISNLHGKQKFLAERYKKERLEDELEKKNREIKKKERKI